MFSREKLGKAAAELADHIKIIDNIKSLQTGQKELADAIKIIGEKIHKFETDLLLIKAEVKLECIKETQSIINSVQGDLNQRLENTSNKVAVIESKLSQVKMINTYDSSPSNLLGGPLNKDHGHPG